MEKKDILLIIIGIAVLIIVVVVAAFTGKKELGSVTILTDKDNYKIGEALKVKINNQLDEAICFSSCYPYYIQKKGISWENYDYIECPEDDLAEKCVGPNEVKAFELDLPEIDHGMHRLAVSACLGCNIQDKFKEDQKFYSNQFIVK